MRSRLLLLFVMASLVAEVGPGVSAASASPAPVEMSFACALNSNGLLRYVTNLTKCKKTETGVTIKPGPVYVCVQPDGSARRVSAPTACPQPPAARLLVILPPTSGTVYFCAANSTGILRYVTSPSQCTSSEFPVFVPPNDAAPSVTSTSPSNGANHVATTANIVVGFSESVSATTSSFSLECPTGTPKSFSVSGSPSSSITLDPTADLPQGTTCTVKVIANQISDSDAIDPPDHMAADYVFSFATDSAPAVVSTNPVDAAVAVATNANVVVTFSESVAATTSSFTLECPTGTPESFGVTGSGTSTITLDPTADLPQGTTCTVTVIANQISDVDAGDPPDHLAANYVFSFTTADAAPSVTSTSPADGADHVATNANIVVTFSESVAATTSSFTLECPTGTPESFSVSGSGTSTITLDPTADLPQGTTCTVTVIANQISDSDAIDPPDHMVANYVFSFATDSAPIFTASTPADGATAVDPSATIEVDFSEPVNVTTSSFTIECPTGTPETFTVSGSGTSAITLTPDSTLPSTTTCTVTAIAANISDVDTGDPPDHPAANASFSFTTVDAAPSVSNTSPADGATGVAKNSNIVVTFSESVAATTSSFTIECPTGTPESFGVTGSGTSTITLDPTADLPQGTTCTVTVIANQISDSDAIDPPDHMVANYVFSFATAANQAPTDIALGNSSVDENQPSGTAVGTLSTTDADAGDTFTYSLVVGTGDTDNASFQISGDQLQTNAVFDFETKASYSIRVRSTDSGSLFTETVFTISINDLNEAPTDISLDNQNIDENKPSGSLVGNLSQAGDPEAGSETFTFSLPSTGCGGGPFADNSSFQISGSQLQSAVAFDFETKASYSICVRVTDSGSPAQSFDKQLTISINDVDDAPVAADDTFNGSNSALAGVTLAVSTSPSDPHVSISGNVLANDTDQDTPHANLTASAGSSTTNSGVLSMNSDGTFTYTPAPGFTGDDTFTYTVHDNAIPDLTDTGTVTIHVVGPRVWFVNPGGAPGNGTSASPFNSLSPLSTGGGSDSLDGSGDVIFVYQGFGNAASNGFVLEASQRLVGQPQGLSVTDSLSRTFSLVSAGGSNPTITNVGGAGITLAGGNTIQRIDVSGATGAGVTGTSVSDLTYGSSTSISGNTGGGLVLSGAASGTISVGAAISTSSGHAVSIQNRTGGTVTLSGTVTDSGTGILLNSNTGATLAFTADLTLSTGTNAGFTATGGGTVTATGTNTITTTTGTALTVTSTTIGASGLTFRSIASNGAVNGINLDTTGSSGGLTVTGTGSAGTGGTIQSSTGAGIVLTSTKAPSFSWMNVQTGADDGIRGSSVAGFTLANSTVSGNGNAVGENGLEFTGLTGTASISSSSVTGSAENNVSVVDSTGSLTLTVTASTFSNTSTTVGNDGIHLDANDTAGMTVSVTGSTFNHNRGDHFQLATNASATGTNSVTFSTNTLTGDRGSTHGGTDLGGGVTINTDAGSHTSFTLASNDVQGAVDSALKIDLGTNSTAGGTLSGTISGNTIGTAATADSGSAQANGISATLQGSGTETVAITSNTVRQYNLNGINVLTRLGAPTLNATITSNTVSNPGAFALNGILVSAGASSTLPDAGLLCAGISSNSITGAGANGADPTATDFRVRQRFSTTVRLPGYLGAATDTAAVIAFIQGNNGSTPTGSATVQSPGGGFVGGSVCPTP